jgi:biopolymer transport protein ExbD
MAIKSIRRIAMRFYERQDGESQFQLTPMIDIVFLLLIWLIVSYYMVEEERSLDIRLPEAQAAQERPRVLNDLVLDIDSEGKVTCMRRQFTYEGLEERLRLLAEYTKSLESDREAGAIIRADQNTPHRYIMAVMDICSRAGVRRVYFAAQKASSDSSADK